MRHWFKFVLYLVVFFAFSSARAGSYEDYFAAIKQDNAGAVRALLQRGFDANTLDPSGLHGLFLAVREPSPKVAELLIAWPKTNVEFRTKDDESPLMIAALKGHMPLVRQLIERGADVNKPGWAPLHYAATNAHLEIMTLLLEHHAFIDAESPNGTTPLMMAAFYGNAAAVRLLLEAGADATMRNQRGLTALDFAFNGERKDAAELISAHLRRQKPKGQW